MQTFRSQFTKKFLLKHHMALILLGTGLSGVLANRWLFHNGIDHMVIRYPPAVVFSFAAFLLLMRVWLSYISRIFQPTNTVIEFEGPEDHNTNKKDEPRWNLDGTGLDSLMPDEPCGCLVCIFLVIIFGIFICSWLLIAEAPLILAEAAFQFLLAAGLLRAAKRIDRPDWVGSIIARTWKPFVVVLVGTLILGGWAEGSCKNPTTIIEMIKSCGGDKRNK
jgi:hypothetical protein